MKLKVKKKTSYSLTGLRAKHVEYLIKVLTYDDAPHETIEEDDIRLSIVEKLRNGFDDSSVIIKGVTGELGLGEVVNCTGIDSASMESYKMIITEQEDFGDGLYVKPNGLKESVKAEDFINLGLAKIATCVGVDNDLSCRTITTEQED